MGLIASVFLASCGGGGGSETGPTNNDSTQGSSGGSEASDSNLKAGYYPAANGSGADNFYDLKMAQDGYLDLTTWKSTVSLLGADLALIDAELTTNDLIKAGTYKVKINYQPTSLLPGNLTVFSFFLSSYDTLLVLTAGSYQAIKDLGTYSEYYRLDLSKGGYVDVSTTKGSVYVFNYSRFGVDLSSLNTSMVQVEGNKFLEPGLYMVKFTYTATSLTPGTVSINFNAN